VFRTPNRRGEGARLFVYAAAGTGAGALAGALLGLLGGLVPVDVRVATAVILSLAIGVVAMVELAGRRVPLLQMDRETPYGWLAPGPLWWALRNGASLGFGARTRLGFWLWYVIPLGALLAADPILGAVGYGLYGFTRTAGVAGLVRLERRGLFTDVDVLRSSWAARIVTNAQLVLIAVLTITLAGS
jgi:hypothetical protein